VVRIIQKVEHGILFVIIAVIMAILGKWYFSRRSQAEVVGAALESKTVSRVSKKS
jgi:Flp pilus assembly pilin Flp